MKVDSYILPCTASNIKKNQRYNIRPEMFKMFQEETG